MAQKPKAKLPNILPKVEELLGKELSQLSVQELGIIGNAIVGVAITKDNPLAKQLKAIVPAFNQECFLMATRLLQTAAQKNPDALKDAAMLMKYLSAERRAQISSLLSKAMKANSP